MKTIKKECSTEFEEKKSRFITYIKPVLTKEEAEKFIQEIKNKHYDATHNCSAYKINFNGVEYFKVDDDGEPSGTAGKPMGDIINYMGVTNLVAVVTRYFGGIKLGAGGLIRNYAKAVKLAINFSGISEFVEKIEILVEIPYDKSGEFENILKEYEYEIIEKSFLDRIVMKMKIEKNFLNQLSKLNLSYILMN